MFFKATEMKYIKQLCHVSVFLKVSKIFQNATELILAQLFGDNYKFSLFILKEQLVFQNPTTALFFINVVNSIKQVEVHKRTWRAAGPIRHVSTCHLTWPPAPTTRSLSSRQLAT